MELARDFSEFIALLNKFKVDYLVVGGYAMGFHAAAQSFSQSTRRGNPGSLK